MYQIGFIPLRLIQILSSGYVLSFQDAEAAHTILQACMIQDVCFWGTLGNVVWEADV